MDIEPILLQQDFHFLICHLIIIAAFNGGCFPHVHVCCIINFILLCLLPLPLICLNFWSCKMDVPLCPSCNHHHIQGVKCTICGHVGRSQIFPKMQVFSNCISMFQHCIIVCHYVYYSTKAKASELSSFRIHGFNASIESIEYWETSTMIRNMCTLDMLEKTKTMTDQQMHDRILSTCDPDAYENESRHILGYCKY